MNAKSTTRIVALIVTVGTAAMGFTRLLSQSAVPQPAAGPGGAEYRHSEVIKTTYETGNQQYWIYEPASPKPERAPLVVFNHGWSAMNPRVYGAWIEHIVRRGNILVYPRYQADLRTPPKSFASNAIGAVKSAIRRLETEPGRVRPDLTRFAIVGHSAGGNTTANMAALAASAGLPMPKAVMCVEPGNSWVPQRIAIPLDRLDQMQPETLLLCVVGDEDGLARDVDARRIFRETVRVPLSNKNFITLVSDRRGSPPLIASHHAPVAFDERYDSGEPSRIGGDRDTGSERPGGRLLRRRIPGAAGRTTPTSRGVDALDYYGLWKLFDGLCDAAFYGRNRQYALGNTPEQRFMGKWPDGVPVKELVVTTRP